MRYPPSARLSRKGIAVSGIESAIPNRESSDSESCDSNRAIPRSLSALIGCDSDGDSESTFRDSTLLCFDSIFLLLAAEFLEIPGSRFWESCDSRFRAAKVYARYGGGVSRIGPLSEGPGDTYLKIDIGGRTRRAVRTGDVVRSCSLDAPSHMLQALYVCDLEVALQTPKPRKIQRGEKVTQK